MSSAAFPQAGTIFRVLVSNPHIRDVWVAVLVGPVHDCAKRQTVPRLFVRVRFSVNTFDLVGTSAPRPLPKWLPPTGGLLVAAVVASFVCRWPVVHSLSLRELIGTAVENVLEVFLANGVTVWALCAIPPRITRLNPRRLILRTSLDALWLAPLVLFIREDSAWAAVIAAVLVASVVKSFHVLHDADVGHSEESLLLALRCNPFSLTASSPCFRRQIFGAGTALCAQTGALAAFAGYSFTAAVLIAISSAVWTWSFTSNAPPDRQNPSPSQSSSRALLIVALAIVFTAAGLIRYLPRRYGIRGFGIPSRYHSRQGFPQGDRRGEPSREKTSEGSVVPASQGDPGIILWPKKPAYTKLVAPAPAVGNGLLASHRSADPLVIPFGGVYWFFKAPDVHPPRTSRQAQGSPEVLDIRSTDRRPLSMEAHENFGSMIDMDCCSRIQIAIRNADRYPETVSMELVLINTTVRGKPSQSLGTMMVKSTRPWTLYDERPPASETLNFVIPAHAAIRRFDEVMVVFRLDAARADAGPKIAIDRFVLVPRGL